MKNLFYVTFLMLSLSAFAQNRFIEVEVRDTLTLTPVSFEYIVRVEPRMPIITEVDDYNMDPVASKAIYVEKTNDLRKLLEAKKYNFKSLYDTNYEVNSMTYHSDSGFIISLKNIEELRNLKKLLGNLDYVYGSMGNVQYGGEDRAEEELIKKLIGKARSKANIVAEASGLKLGNIIEVKEVNEIDNFMFNIADVYASIGKSGRLGMHKGDLTGSISKALVVKFAAE